MKKGDIIKFGKYPQDNYSFRTPIEWLVLDVKGNEALLISRYGLDRKRYHPVWENTTWEDCDLRKWLNSDFLKSAFSNEESERILVSELRNDDNPEYGTPGGNDTKDRIFCLSIAEAEQYFSSDDDRQCRPTAYAREQGAEVSSYDCCYWWLRSPGYCRINATLVDADGSLSLLGDNVNDGAYDAVRPALRIIFDETLEQRNRCKEEERRQREEQERRQRELQAIIKKGIRKGMIIPFGAYPQDNYSFIRPPIEWLVLDVKGNEALLISRYALDSKRYHHEWDDITWEDCELRKWLNSDFLKSAFSNEESERILVSELKNDDNPKYGTTGGNDTKDRIFCLSIAEAQQYFISNEDRQCRPTAYARKHGAHVYNNCCDWWFRSPGYDPYDASHVNTDGSLNLFGRHVDNVDYAVRPALRIIYNETLEQRKQREEEERRQREEQERKQREEQERRQREEQERRQREEQERRQREEQERRQREEQERKQREIQIFEMEFSDIKVGSFITYGRYFQDSVNAKSPIEWLVLDVKGNEALLISRYALDCKIYHYGWVSISWEDCDLRKWLNSDFLKSAFSNEESERILVSELRNDYNPKWRIRGENDTKDRIFCLSIAEAEQYFSSDEDRQCRPTAYARNHRAYVKNDCCFWWLRSPSSIQNYGATYVCADGALGLRSDRALNGVHRAVRPALRIICNL